MGLFDYFTGKSSANSSSSPNSPSSSSSSSSFSSLPLVEKSVEALEDVQEQALHFKDVGVSHSQMAIEKLRNRIDPALEPYLIATAVFGVGTLAVVFYRTRLRRIVSAAYLTPDMLQGKRLLKGRVTSVGDADNFRFYHTPGGIWAGWGWLRHVPKEAKALKDQTLHVRLAGVDAPEGAHFGMPAQPFSAEALAWLRNHLLGKNVVIKPFARDRYDRVVSMAWSPRYIPLLPKKNVSLELLKVGYGQVYKQAGAEYGGALAEFEKVENVAKGKKIGIWSQKHMVSAADHKKQYLRNGD